MLLVLALCGKVAVAQNAISVEAFTIDSYSTYDIPVLLNNDQPAYNVQFNVALPAELELAGKPYMDTQRCNIQYQSMQWNAKNNRLAILSQSFQPIDGKTGAVAYIPVKLAFGANVNTKYTVTLEHVTVTGAVVNNKPTYLVNNATVEATVTAVPGIVNGYAPAAEITTNPGETFELEFAFTNTCNVLGFTVDLTVPAGFEVGTDAKLAERVTPGTQVRVTNNEGYTRFVVYNLSGDPAITGSNKGLVFTVPVTAPEGWEGAGQLTFSDLLISYLPGKEFKGAGYNVALVNGATAYTKAKTAIEGLEKALTDKLAEIATAYPAVADQISGDAITAQIDALKAAVDAAYADHTLTANYDTVMAPAAGIATAIEALSAQAAEAQRKYDNEAGYNEYVAVLAAAQEMLDAAKATAQETYPAANVTKEVAAAQDAITAAKQQLEAAKQACATEGNFQFNFDMGALEALINKIVPEAKRQQENADAAAEYTAMLEAAQQMLEDAKTKVATDYPGTNVSATVAEAQAAIDQAKADLAAAIEACATEGSFKFDFNMGALEAEIAKVEAAAKAQADLVAEYAEMISYVEGLLTEAKETVATDYPAADVTALVSAVEAKIAQAKADFEAAKATLAEEGTFKMDFDMSAYEAEIAKIVPEAKRQAENAALEAEVAATLEYLQTYLNETVESVNTDYPGVFVTNLVDAAQAAIDQAKTDFEAAKAACATEGSFQFNFDTMAVEMLIAKIKPEAKRQYDNIGSAAEYEAMLAYAQEQLDAAKTTVATDYAGTDVEALVKAAQDAIDQANVDLAAAVAACATEGDFHFDFNMGSIEALIAKIVPEAKRQADNAATYAEYNAMLDYAQELLDEAKETVATTYPTANVNAEVKAAQDAINKARKELDEAKAACATEGNLVYAFDMGALETLINAVVNAAKYQATIEAAYNSAVAAIDALQAKLNTTKETVASLYDDVNVDEIAEAAQAAITKAYNDAQAALEAAGTAGAFEYTVPTADIEALIAAIAPEAKRQSDNKKAYEADLATIAGLEADLKATLEEVAAKYPTVGVTAQTLAAQNAIADAKKAVEEAYANVAEAGKYVSPLDAAAIKALIDEIMVIASGIDEVIVEELGGDVKFYNLNGIQVKNPAAGTVVIGVGANGKTRKMIVK